ncbi:MAG: sugar phosphate isomerase/epimerase [Acidobacteriota bacterium]
MTMQFSLAHLSILGCAPPELAYIAARAGYDFISPRLIMMGVPEEHNHNYNLATNREMLRQTKAALASTGIKVRDIELARIHDAIDVKSFVPVMDVAADLGARHLISSVWTADRSLALERFDELCDLAVPFGLTVDLEFVTWSSLINLAQTVEFLHKVGRRNAGVLIDVLHFHRSRVSPEELEGVPREWFHCVHLCDAPTEIPKTETGLIHAGRAERLYIGEGGIDIAAIVRRIPLIPYTLEVPHVERSKEVGYAEHALRCLESAKRYLSMNSLAETKGMFECESSNTAFPR